jgi:hypothetical protein
MQYGGLRKAGVVVGNLEKESELRPFLYSDNIRINRKGPEESGLFLELRYHKELLKQLLRTLLSDDDST